MARNIRYHLRKLTTRLSSRLLLMVCITFLPLNIATFILSCMIFTNASHQVVDAWQREILSMVTSIESNFQTVDSGISQFVDEYLSDLMLDGSDSIATINMVDTLGDGFSNAGLPGFLFLQDKKTGTLYIQYDTSAYSITQIEDLKLILKSNSYSGTSAAWQIIQLDDAYYYNRQFEYSNYRLGVYVDIEKTFSSVHSNAPQNEDVFLISDGKTVLNRSPELEWSQDDATRNNQNGIFRWIEWNSDSLSMGCTIGISYGRLLEMIPVMCWVLIFFAVLSCFLVVLIWRSLQNQVVQPLAALQHGMEELEDHNMNFRLDPSETAKTDEIRYLYDAFNHMAQEVSASYEKDIQIYQTELDNLRLQVNPHMLLNSYNTIYSLAQTKNYVCIQEYTLHLSDYFRYVLRQNNTFVPLEREMQFINHYIAIQEIRFPGMVNSHIAVTDAAKKALIPPLLVENFVENAMKYALIPGKIIDVTIKAWQAADRLQVSIEDNGQGIKPEILQAISKGDIYVDDLGHRHIGIHNCRRRMELFYVGKTHMNISSEYGKGTTIFLDLPYWLPPSTIPEEENKNETVDR